MSQTCTHYSNSLIPNELNRISKIQAKKILKDFAGNGKFKKFMPRFIYSGMSGVSAATALALNLKQLNPRFKFNMSYVRKKREKSHGQKIEFSYYDYEINKKELIIFVDDFVEQGNSLVYTYTNYLNFEKKLDTPDDMIVWKIDEQLYLMLHIPLEKPFLCLQEELIEKIQLGLRTK